MIAPKNIRVAITRAEPEASATAARIKALGAEPVLAPLLEIKPLAFDSSLDGVQALLFTSANGVRAYAQTSASRTIRALCVGDATARAAQDAGFAEVKSADGDSMALAKLAVATLDPRSGLVLHISGRETAGDIAASLAVHGFKTKRRIAYLAEMTQKLPDGLRNPCDFILFHSARGAEAFIALGAPHASETVAACLSDQIARAAASAAFKRIIVAPRPREDALLQAVLSP